MRTFVKCLGTVLLVAALAGCANQGSAVKTKRGAVAGGALGAVVGGVIGHQSGRGLEGAAIDAGAGAVGGGLLGSAADEQETQQQPQVDPYGPKD